MGNKPLKYNNALSFLGIERQFNVYVCGWQLKQKQEELHLTNEPQPKSKPLYYDGSVPLPKSLISKLREVKAIEFTPEVRKQISGNPYVFPNKPKTEF
jgi:hypothetical protein